MYIKHITFSDLRCFKTAEMELKYPGKVQDKATSSAVVLENVNLILGVNGYGKTTVLKALTLSLLAQFDLNSGFRPYSLVRRDETGYASKVVVSTEVVFGALDRLKTPEPLQTITLGSFVERKGTQEVLRYERSNEAVDQSELFEELYLDNSPSFFMVAYGATRRVESGEFDSSFRFKSRAARYNRIAGLFEDHLALTPLRAWLPKVHPKARLEEVINLIQDLLPDGLGFEGLQEQDEYVFNHHGINVAFPALSDGYRAYIGWITDLVSHLVTVCPERTDLRDLTGVVLVDEIDLHVHPTWQRLIVAQIANALPKLQFVFTTHSPIVAGSVSSRNLFVVAESEDGTSSVISRPEAEIYGLSADQVLTSSMFGLSSTRAPGFVKELEKLESKATQGNPEAAMALMRGLSRGAGATLETEEDVPDWVKAAAKKTPAERKRKLAPAKAKQLTDTKGKG